MQFIKTLFEDVLYVSKITGTQKKKLLIVTSVLCSQLAVLVDVFLIGLFAFLIADQKTNIELDEIATYFDSNRYLLLLIVFEVYITLQSYILRRIEFTVTKNLKVFILTRIFERRTYSISDVIFTLILSGHIGYFYSNFASFLNSCINILVFGLYLLISNFEVLTILQPVYFYYFFLLKK